MTFNSFTFICIFPIIFILYWFVNSRKNIRKRFPAIGNILLLAISYTLYLKVEPAFVLILLWVTAVTFLAAKKIESDKAYGKKKYLIFTGVILAVFPLLIFKYYNFISSQLNFIFNFCGIDIGLPGLNWVIPIGLSFYTLQAVGYLLDVYFTRIKAEHNWWSYMLFVSFFPQIASGPISKAIDLLPQINNKNRKFNYDQFVEGCRWLLWGMFLKVCVADRIGTIINPVLSNYMYNDGGSLISSTLLYSFQIYSDFAGYSFMAMGTGKILGFDLINNFNRPYFSVSITDFWRRWHISLSTWLKDYIYIPLGGNRCSKLRNYFNIIVTFLVSGIWHGANWTYIIWGVFHGIAQVVEKFLGLNKRKSNYVVSSFRIIFTFCLVSIFWIFFRMPSITDACQYITCMLRGNSTIDFGLIINNKTLLIPLYMLVIKDFIDEFAPKFSLFHNKYTIIRWSNYILLTSMILLFGVFDASQFIYISF